MADELFTRCPECKTVFRVTEPQLALRQGQVRCGHCRTIFNGRDELIALDPPAQDDPDAPLDELAAGPPTVTLRSAHALDPPPSNAASPVPGSSASRADEASVDVQDYENRFAWAARKPASRLWKVLGAIAIPILVAALVVQAIVHYRDALAAHFPRTKPTLAALCSVLGCKVQALRNAGELSIEASDLREDPAHKGLLILSATIRNRAAVPIGYPHLELTLTDASDQVVVRRALAPADYVSGTVDTSAGIAAHGEVPVRLFIDASATTQAGYRIYLFFP
ncbi:MAG: DUF3426 domain-containing protein [Burkholderiales bacterium]|nr:DUF3426 domain-containing protein [Burkholderiales bacterium]